MARRSSVRSKRVDTQDYFPFQIVPQLVFFLFIRVVLKHMSNAKIAIRSNVLTASLKYFFLVHVFVHSNFRTKCMKDGMTSQGKWSSLLEPTVIFCEVFNQHKRFVLFNDATGTHWFLSYHRLLDVIHMVTLTHFLEGNPLPPHRLLFSISSKGSFICTFP